MTRIANLLLPMLLLAASPAFAHAFLKNSTPPVGSDVPVSPKAVIIDFTEGVEPAFSTIEVQNAQGKRVDDGHPHLVNGNQARLAVNLPKLPPGTYRVTWHATSVDTHKTQGTFRFTVSP
ncbi:MAG TPA: copper resistance protein CopC [Acetobacteraceae bacterium]|nr:copper resistance protein CopC [Acetobacteraceae bacterium]